MLHSHGEKKSVMGDLNDKGEARARNLVNLFRDGGKFQQPEALFAGPTSPPPFQEHPRFSRGPYKLWQI